MIIYSLRGLFETFSHACTDPTIAVPLDFYKLVRMAFHKHVKQPHNSQSFPELVAVSVIVNTYHMDNIIYAGLTKLPPFYIAGR